MSDKDFVSYLRAEFQNRQKADAEYSLRAFARDLSIEPSQLSKIFHRKLPVTIKMFDRVAFSAGLTEPLLSEYRQVIQDYAGLPHVEYQTKTLLPEEFKIIQDWYHLAIVELVHLHNFKPEAQWIARKLQISIDEANAAFELPEQDRSHVCITVSLDASLIPVANRRLAQMARSIVDDLHKQSQKKNQVYGSICSFYPVTKLTRNKPEA